MISSEILDQSILYRASLSRYTTWRVGGPAEVLYLPENLSDLSRFLFALNSDTPLTWIGLGSNVLIRDAGISGVVIVTQGGLQDMHLTESGLLRAEAGVATAKLSRFAARQGLTGIEFMAGIPGTVGGALTMNAGCYGGETWGYVQCVETIDRTGKIHLRKREEFTVSYRSVKLPENEWFVAGYFALTSGDSKTSLEKIKTLLAQRNAAQPTSLPNCGSVFRNPEGNFAARLIEQCGLKNKRIGGAAVSEKHANFIVNDQSASAADIEQLIHHVQETVSSHCGITLIPEVRILGELTR